MNPTKAVKIWSHYRRAHLKKILSGHTNSLKINCVYISKTMRLTKSPPIVPCNF